VSEQTRGGSGEFAAGSVVAGYRLEEQIGQGGMAVVFRAHDPRLDRDVALKIMAPGLALDDAFRQRFIRESRAAAAVDDPHIIPVYEAGEENGVLFIAMRYVRGGDVRSLLDRDGWLPAGRATEIVSQVASALDSAHARGLVHRDVKPANMLLEENADSDRPDHVYLSDFGLTKTSLAATGLTATGQFLGTLDYVAPEQIEGRAVDGRTDLYALACAAFELLTGAPPFRRDQGMAVMYAQVSEPPPLLSSRRAALPAAADGVLTKALAKSPADRFATCREFASELRRVFGLRVDSGPHPDVPARPPTQIAASVPPAGPPDPVPVPDPSGPGLASAGPPTQAAGVPAGSAGSSTRAGLTDPSAGPASAPRPGGGPPGGGPAGGGPAGAAGEVVSRPGQARPWWRTPVSAVVAGLAVVVLAGGGYLLFGRGGGSGSSSGRADSAKLVVPVGRSVACSSGTQQADTLASVGSLQVAVHGSTPFAVQESRDGKYTFVTVKDGLAVLRNVSGAAPSFVRMISIPGSDKGLFPTEDGRYLLIANGNGAVVVDAAKAELGSPRPVLGELTAPALSPGGNGAVGVRASANGKFVFVTLQNTTKMAVFNLGQALADNFRKRALVGYVPLGVQPVGIGESPDGSLLYVTSFQAGHGQEPSEGTLSVVNRAKAQTDPATAVQTTVRAGCSPARIVTSGGTVWVTARDSNTLLGFSASKLLSEPAKALVAQVRVGAQPIGLTLVNGGRRIVIADSNSAGGHSPGSLAVVDSAQALAGHPAVLGYVPAGGQPRQLTVGAAGDVILATNQVSNQLQQISVAALP
jgi:serine/threonine protein kinase